MNKLLVGAVALLTTISFSNAFAADEAPAAAPAVMEAAPAAAPATTEAAPKAAKHHAKKHHAKKHHAKKADAAPAAK